MSHISEGDLHAYLDGQLEQSPRRAIESHMAECPACRQEMEKATHIRTRALGILKEAQPVPGPAPSFDAILARAGRGGQAPRRPFWRRAGLAWAATITVALGAGWFARGEFTRPADPAMAASPATPQPTASSQDAVSPVERPSAPRQGVAAGSGAAGATATEEKASGIEAYRPGARESDQAPAKLEKAASTTGQVAASILDSVRERRANAGVAQAKAAESLRVVAAAPAAAPPPVPVAGLAARTAPQSAAEPERISLGNVVTDLSAEQVLGERPLVVPDHAIVSQAVVREPEGLVVRTTQLVGDGAMLELTQRKVPTADAVLMQDARQLSRDSARRESEGLVRFQRSDSAVRARSANPAVRTWLGSPSQVTVTRGGFTITGRAPVSPDSLRALLTRLR